MNFTFTKNQLILLISIVLCLIIAAVFFLYALIIPSTNVYNDTITKSVLTSTEQVNNTLIQIPNIVLSNRTEEKYADKATQDIFERVNSIRTTYGIGPLIRNKLLDASACSKAQNMQDISYWGHFGPNKETPWIFINKSGYQYTFAGENLAADFSNTSTLVNAWKNSPSHYKNIVDTDFVDEGLCVMKVTIPQCLDHIDDSNYLCLNNKNNLRTTIVVVQHFGKPTF